MAAEKKGRTGENYILSGRNLSFGGLVKVVGEVTGKKVPQWTCPMQLARIAAPFSQRYSGFSGKELLFTSEALGALQANHDMRHEKAAKELGYSPRPIMETIKDVFIWYKENGII